MPDDRYGADVLSRKPNRRAVPGGGGRAGAWIDDLPGRVAESGTVPGRRLGVLVDHLVAHRREPASSAAR